MFLDHQGGQLGPHASDLTVLDHQGCQYSMVARCECGNVFFCYLGLRANGKRLQKCKNWVAEKQVFSFRNPKIMWFNKSESVFAIDVNSCAHICCGVFYLASGPLRTGAIATS